VVSIQCCDVGGRGLWMIDKWAEAPVGEGQKGCHYRQTKGMSYSNGEREETE